MVAGMHVSDNKDAVLAQHAYGKDRIRVVKVVRDHHPVHHVHDLDIGVLLTGYTSLVTSYTHADNSLVVATDTIKNIVNLRCYSSPYTGTPELLALDLARFFLDTYAHIDQTHVSVTLNIWDRIVVNDAEHPHAFKQNTGETRMVRLTLERPLSGQSAYHCSKLESSLQNLVVLKTTESSFSGFHQDQYRTLPDAADRILSTKIDCRWSIPPKGLSLSQLFGIDWDAVYHIVKSVTLTRFAVDNSPSVQGTLWEMAVEILAKVPKEIFQIYYSLPNRHVFAIDLSKWGIKNEGPTATLFKPLEDPNGLITAVVARPSLSKL